MKYYLISGEASGDLHGARLAHALRAADPAAELRGWGGDRMAAAGVTVVKHYRELAFMGFVEVVANLRTILRNERACRADIAAFAPDRLILIDYPGFNLRIARWARPAGYDITYYIAPQVWAWHSSRVKALRRDVDRLLVILPFEADFFARHGVDAHFVGHPLLDVVDDRQSTAPAAPPPPDDADRIVLLPGSRKQEIRSGLPTMLAAAARHPDYDYVIAGAPGQEPAFYDQLLTDPAGPRPPRLRTAFDRTYELLTGARAALVTSGTATLETALFGVPQVVCYRGNPLSYAIARRLVARRIKYISLVNLVMDAPVVTELIQHDFTPERLATEFEKIIAGPERDRQLADLARLRDRLGAGGAAERAAARIVAD